MPFVPPPHHPYHRSTPSYHHGDRVMRSADNIREHVNLPYCPACTRSYQHSPRQSNYYSPQPSSPNEDQRRVHHNQSAMQQQFRHGTLTNRLTRIENEITELQQDLSRRSGFVMNGQTAGSLKEMKEMLQVIKREHELILMTLDKTIDMVSVAFAVNGDTERHDENVNPMPNNNNLVVQRPVMDNKTPVSFSTPLPRNRQQLTTQSPMQSSPLIVNSNEIDDADSAIEMSVSSLDYLRRHNLVTDGLKYTTRDVPR